MKKIKNISIILLLSALWLSAARVAVGQNSSLSELTHRATTLGIEQSHIDALKSRATANGISEEALSHILEKAVSMQEQHLPGDPVIQKALEGMSKHIPENRIIPVLDNLEQSMTKAARVIDPWINQPEIKEKFVQQKDDNPSFRNELVTAAAHVLEAKISEKTVNDILLDIGKPPVINKATTSNVVAAISILPDLPTSHKQQNISKTFVVRAVKNGFGADDLQKLPTALALAQQRSQLPASTIIEGVSNQLNGGVPAAKVLQNLFNGDVGGGPPGGTPPGLIDNPGRGHGQGRGNNGNNGNHGNNGRGNGNGNM